MDKSVKGFLNVLLNASDAPRPWEPDIGDIEKISPENFRLISSIIKICRSVTDEQITNYIVYLNKALENSGEFKKFHEMMENTKSVKLPDEEFL
jgi:hypothetical protein